jgi:hypothetical protein
MPTLKERIDADLKDAMRSKNELKLSVVRMLKSAIKYKEVEPGASALDDAGIEKVIAGLIKQPTSCAPKSPPPSPRWAPRAPRRWAR